MEMTTKVKLSGIYLVVSLLAMTGEVNDNASMAIFLSYYIIGSINLYFAAKLYSHLLKSANNVDKSSANRDRVS